MGYLQADCVLLDLLGALPLVLVGRLNAQLQGQFAPGLDLFALELCDQLEEGPGAERFASALWWSPESLPQDRCLCFYWDSRVAVQDKLHVDVLDRVDRHISGRLAEPCRYRCGDVDVSQDMGRIFEQMSARVLHYEHRSRSVIDSQSHSSTTIWVSNQREETERFTLEWELLQVRTKG